MPNSEAFNNDTLNRKQVAEQFRTILLSTDLNVFSLVAPWGGGKSYFINNLVKIMEENSINIIYNAWESDFYESPLIPLLIELLAKLENCKPKTKLQKDIKWAKNFADNICKKTNFQVGINACGFECSANFDPTKKMIESDYIDLKLKIKEFKNKLMNIQKIIGKKIFIFIDELDRCHPMYTIKTLEVIKHFFGIPNIIFVLAVDKKQIENSVRTIYGINQGEENGYLRKFIDVEFVLPIPKTEQFVKYQFNKLWFKIQKFIDNKHYYNYNRQLHFDSFGIARGIAWEKEQNYLSEYIAKIVKIFNFSLRDIEKFFYRLSLILEVHTSKDILLIEPCLVLNALAMKNDKDFDNYIISKPEGIVNNVNKELLSLWKGFFYNSYRQELINYRRSTTPTETNTLQDNVNVLNRFLSETYSNIIDEQEKYLQNYPQKIKFINNFNSYEQ